MQLPLRNNVFGRLNWRRGVFRGWALGLIVFLFFLFLPQLFAPLISQGISPVFPDLSPDLLLDVLGFAGIYVIMALGLNVVVGFAGLLDLGYAAFFAIGAYSYGLANSQSTVVSGNTLHLSIWPLLLAAPVIAAMFGVMLGAPTLRLRGDYLAIVTLGFGEIVPVIFRNVGQLNLNLPAAGTISFTLGSTFGFEGLDPPSDLNLPFQAITFSQGYANFYYLVFALVVIAAIALALLRRSRIGRAWVAIREDETAAACSGVNLVATKLTAFAIGASVSGFAGVIFAAESQVIQPDSFQFVVSITILVMVVLGGMGSIPGVITGGLVIGIVSRMILELSSAIQAQNSLIYIKNPDQQHAVSRAINESQALIYGVVLLAVILLRPQGLIPSAIRKRELKSQTLAVIEIGGSKVLMEVPTQAPETSTEIEVLEALEVAQEVGVEALARSPGEGDGYGASPGQGAPKGGSSE